MCALYQSNVPMSTVKLRPTSAADFSNRGASIRSGASTRSREIRVPIAFIGSEIQRPVRNDILVDAYTIDPAGNYPDSLIKLPMSLSIHPS
jgi:hypothetical protein